MIDREAIEQRLVEFVLGNQNYALRLECVERVLHAVEVTPLPKSPDVVMGVVNAGGDILPVFNLSRRFGLPDRKVAPDHHFLFARTRSRRVVLVVDRVLGVIRIAEDWILEPQSILPKLEYLSGVVRSPDGMVFIHDLNSFLSMDEEEALTHAIRGRSEVKP